MKDYAEKMRAIASDLLSTGQVNLVLGWGKGNLWYKSPPVFIKKVEDVDRLIFDEFCHNNLSKYMIDLAHHQGKVAVFVKGCDSRGINRLIQDNVIKREQVYVIGLPCSGLKDPEDAIGKKAGEAVKDSLKCESCAYPNPVSYDVLIGEEVPVRPKGQETLNLIEKINKMTPDERYQYWAEQFNKCIRCYACRNVCPACNCRECIFDQASPDWLGKANNLAENQFMQMTRAMHVAGRCIECGECERACPMNIPLMAINKKLGQDVAELFGDSAAGVDLEKKPPLGHFELNDPEKFM